MFVGHALLAFAFATLVAERRGWPARRALALGVATGAFAALPDVDVLYAVVALDPGQLVVNSGFRPDEFWGTASVVHRSTTHSLVVAVVAGAAFGAWALCWRRARTAGRDLRALSVGTAVLGVLAVLVVLSAAAGGPASGFVMAAFVVAGLALATASQHVLSLSPRVVAVAALFGLASHPWGDVVTGEPPHLLFPLDGRLLGDRLALSADPTLHLLGAFALELAVIVLAALVVARHAGVPARRLVDRRAALGVGYGVAAVVMAPPSIHTSYQFVGSILAVGAVCGGLRHPRSATGSLRALHRRALRDPEQTLRTACTALAGIAVAVVSYAAVYLLVG